MSHHQSRFFRPNLDPKGRRVRGWLGVALLLGAVGALAVHWLPALVLAVAGGFTLFEARRGWCALRACGIKTRV